MQKIDFKTSGKKLEVSKESNLLRMSIRYEGGIPYKCGGGICGTCVVKIDDGAQNLSKVSKKEVERLGEDLIAQGYRLACQTFVNGDVELNWEENPIRPKRKAAAK
ncbi:2Fe-2S iron-sulfur cluster-binding protein [Aneurinibacillus aneurinilyticus]|jgi:ferredoxin|uniref:2Fe-2S iron-sulfur cluster binding domain-containing protein n=2 Tax=Aneurinibacillus aneurinilyticus TaxID=1391 RepID=A0A848CLL3_ANEAE|nr:2Fe-2S iron-sulfur cluster binding domain-containing protein [Aneurinibacillus aneurinilyticus]ERI05892.1 2Fe-2S iron-sulfur cluster binding domain protein [Aneurinibacillus aneurinilyticus ATCC 12856]MCI1692649.1 2Fe-2S iron-sulfur cluster binding domain-containing protein [Aneurinibacillus aneurinilyticus]MED0672762.1 2Fe-2S iron-sulfur cluster binding domain-containing protein [Aneurinibacillus aneurinilyticus]MED0708589.1 2Fe-2S iron-sulfur cluster binding domain-containing protein [Aneu